MVLKNLLCQVTDCSDLEILPSEPLRLILFVENTELEVPIIFQNG